MAVTRKEAGVSLAEVRKEWSTELSFSLMLLIVLFSPLLYDLFNSGG